MNKKLFASAVFALVFSVALSASAYTFDTKIDTLQEKKDMQTVLNMATGSTLTVDGVVGAKTIAALKAFQTLKGLTADGLAGPLTRAALTAASTGTTTGGTTTTGALCPNGMTLASNCTTAPGTTGTTTPSGLTGGAGTITLTQTSTDVESELVAGKTDNVLGVKIEADGSDVSITNAKITLKEKTDDSKSYRLGDYASKVEIYKGSTKIGSADTEDFSKDGTEYTKSISLSNAIVKDGDKDTFYVKMTALSNLDSQDVGKDWNITIGSLRYQDATGVIMSDTATKTEDFSFEDLATSGDVKLVISKASTSPSSGNVEVSDSGTTSNVKLLDFKLKAEGSEMSFDQIKLDLVATNATLASSLIEELILKNGSEEIASTDTIGATSTFDLDDTFTIDADSTETFSVYATMKEVDGTLFANGAKVRASLSKYGIETEDANGDIVTDESGSATGNDQTFYSDGAIVSFVSGNYTAYTSDNGYGTVALKFKVQAFGDNDVVFNEDSFGTTDDLVNYVLSGATSTAGIITSSDMEADSSTGDFTVSAGDTATFTLTSRFTAAPSGFVVLEINKVDGTTVSNVKTASY